MTLSNQDHDLIRWNAEINKVSGVEVALDSGGTRSVISLKLVQDWNLNINNTTTMIENSNGDIKPAIGFTDLLEVNFEGIVSTVSFLITNIKAVDVLLGLDWFAQSGVILDPKNKSFMLPVRHITAAKSEHTYNDEDDLIHSLNMVCLENDEWDLLMIFLAQTKI